MRVPGLLLMTASLSLFAQKHNPSPNPVVHLVSVSQSDEDMKRVVLVGPEGTYVLFCNLTFDDTYKMIGAYQLSRFTAKAK
jgi:hypothetical protein